MENKYIIHEYRDLFGAIGKKTAVAYVSVGNAVAAIGCYEDSGRLDRKDVRQVVENATWDDVYVAAIKGGYKTNDVYEYIVKNIDVLEGINLVADYVRCNGDFLPIVRKGYSAVPEYRMSGIGYYIVPDTVLTWTREYLASKKK